jgi:hypothetical protein
VLSDAAKGAFDGSVRMDREFPLVRRQLLLNELLDV